MPFHPARHLTAVTVSAVLALGAVGAGGAMAIGREPSKPPAGQRHGPPIRDSQVQEADAVIAKAQRLDRLAAVLSPVDALAEQVLKAPLERMPRTRADKLAVPARDALATWQKGAPAAAGGQDASVRSPRISTGITALEKALDDLVKALVSGDSAQVTSAASALITAMGNLAVSISLSGGSE